MTTAVTIRALCADDVPAYRALWLDGLDRFPAAFLLTRDEAANTDDRALIAKCEQGQLWGAFQGDHLVAIAAFHRGTLARLRHMADLGPFYVDPTYQGQGIAKSLLQSMITAIRALGVLQIELCVDAKNTNAIALYQHFGFQTFGTRPRSVLIDGQGRDDHLMVLALDDRD